MVPKGWKRFELNDLFVSSNQGVNTTTERVEYSEQGYPAIRSNNITAFGFDLSDKKFIDETTYIRLPDKYKPLVGDILYCNIGSNLGSAIVNSLESPFIVTWNVFRAVPKTSLIDAAYCVYFLNHKRSLLRSLATESTMPFISAKVLLKFSLTLPPLPEQRKIAQILSTWDKAIATTERLLANKQQQKKALMQRLLTGKQRFAGFEGEWQTCSLTSLFRRVTTKNNGTSSNVVTISGRLGLINQEEFFSKSIASETLDGYYLLKHGQFAYNKSYSNGYPMGAIKRLNRYPDGVVTTLYICFEVKDETVTNASFFEQFFEAGLLNRGLTKIAAEGGRAHGLLNVRPDDFFNLRVTIPVFEEQKAISDVLTKADLELNAVTKKLDNLKQQKKALMQQLLTGKRRVKVDEAAA